LFSPTSTHAHLQMMLHDLASSCVLYFTVSYGINTPVFFFTHTNSTSFCSKSWKQPCLGPVTDFWVQCTFDQLLLLLPPLLYVCFYNACNCLFCWCS